MKKKILITTFLLFIIILVFNCYKFIIHGNTKNIKDVNELEEYILNIRNYEIQAKLTINSNKNTNTYLLNESLKNNKHTQLILNEKTNEGLEIELTNEKMIIKNTKIGLSKIFKKYEKVLNNPLDFESFIQDFKTDTKKEIKQKNNYYQIFVKTEKANKYNTNKTLYFNIATNKFEKMEIKDINNNNKIIIEYISFKML